MSGGRREAGLLLAVLVLQVLGPHTGGTQVGSLGGAVAASAAVAQALLLIRRRTQPVMVALAVVALYAVQVAALDVVPPVAAWVAVATLAGSSLAHVERSTAVVTAALVVVLAAGELAHAGTGLGLLLSGVTVAVALVALLRRSERARLDAVRAQAATEERLRIARDLHDLAGHGLGVVAVQSSTARMALDAGDSATARTALAAVEASSRTALKEMRQLLGVLRDAGTAPAPGLADIATLIDGVRAGGTEITATLADVPVSPGVGLCAYRVVQESLTNAVKHSPGARIDVRITAESELRITVVSRGPSAPMAGGGSGLDGLRSRVEALGGTATIGPLDLGWSVDVRLPLEDT